MRFEDLVIEGNPVALEGAVELLTQVTFSKLHVFHNQLIASPKARFPLRDAHQVDNCHIR